MLKCQDWILRKGVTDLSPSGSQFILIVLLYNWKCYDTAADGSCDEDEPSVEHKPKQSGASSKKPAQLGNWGQLICWHLLN